jgi:hypothetical protein
MSRVLEQLWDFTNRYGLGVGEGDFVICGHRGWRRATAVRRPDNYHAACSADGEVPIPMSEALVTS